MNKSRGLVYVGKIIELDRIIGADFILSATVVCGSGGKWKGVINISDFNVNSLCSTNSLCMVYLPDSLIPRSEEMKFMESSKWRVRMRRFKGAPSEVLIMPCNYNFTVGYDLTELLGVTKYHKPIPVNLQGKAKGDFPSFIPKTDEPNYQNLEGREYLDKLHEDAYYISEKADGSSTTAFKYKGKFGVCSRNWELELDEDNGYWQVARKYDLENKLPEGIALQWETCGPNIQCNSMDLKSIDGFAFSGYNIAENRYLTMDEFIDLCRDIEFPRCKLIKYGISFDKNTVETLGGGFYENGHPREGVVVRSCENKLGHKPISFKVINLDYEN
jgi:RNA ligase (TIGR02306 family)